MRSNIEQTHSAAGYGVGFLPVSPKIDLIGRVGYGNTQFKQTLAGVESKFDADSVNYGVGAQYKLDDKNGVRVDYTRQQFRDNDAADANVVSVGYARKFQDLTCETKEARPRSGARFLIPAWRRKPS